MYLRITLCNNAVRHLLCHCSALASLFATPVLFLEAVKPVQMIIVSELKAALLEPDVAAWRVVLRLPKIQNILCGFYYEQGHHRTASFIVGWHTCPTHILWNPL